MPILPIRAVPRIMEEFPMSPEGYLGSTVMPMNTTEFTGFKIRYFVKDGVQGMTSAHALGTDPKIVKGEGWKEYEYDPIPFKDTQIIDERHILKMADMRDERQVLAWRTQVMNRMISINQRTDTRVEASIWEVLQTGSLVINEDDIKFTQAYGVPAGNFLTVGSGVAAAWASPASATPKADILGALGLFDGLNVDTVRGFCNNHTARLLAGTEQFADLLSGTSDVKSLTPKQIPSLFAQMTDLDSFEVYGKHYSNSSGVRTPFIANNKVILVAEQTGNGPTAEWAAVPSPHLGTVDNLRAGKFAFSNTDDPMTMKNPKVEFTGGIYGAPVLWKPKLVVVLTVA